MRKQSTLKELCYEYSEDFSSESENQPAADCLVKIFDNFAIGFAEWLRVNYYDNGDFWIAWDNDKETKTSEELLEIYKKKKDYER